MVLQFQIKHIRIQHNRGLFILAKHLGENHDFHVPDGAILRDLPVYHYKEIQPKDEVSGEPLKDLFVFRPLNLDRLFDSSFKEGDMVTLTISE